MSNSYASLALELTTPVDDERPVYIAGNFCEWFPDIERFKMQKVEPGKYRFQFPPDFLFDQPLEYKYTRGGWDQVELDSFGEAPQNRKIRTKGTAQKDFVPHWRKDGRAFDVRYVPTVETVSEHFEIPQLGRKRRVRVLLPHDYYTSSKSYPVIYLQDGQNLFEDGSVYGNWEIDKRMAILAGQGKGSLIVVAIDHADEDRLHEFAPYANPKFGKGSGKKYANFIVRTLKPYIDKKYRTRPERQFTGIGGSSMGGLISIYAGLMYPEVLGRLMIFSPSLWVSEKIYFDAIEFFNPMETKIYVYAGGKEGRFMVPSTERLKEAIERQGWTPNRLRVKLSVDPKGEHTETRWGKEFPRAIEWLFFETP
ncbi:alpha/beta hydrolase [Runella slithyformis]|uniref:Esterase n=1 Tax=Runella slithyformis (strain ATCC 29530 / DSM 19594 / LMG 11500 / NCIMB 11436 / LSU 4) TaxID=761193 RepID=A0A7U3ZID2_RUNSL|nr:alpha/beta hydrolase-fold protein [Runella slithyformis]AEI47707.1 esterase [Runella slithyformis DSM 19594]